MINKSIPILCKPIFFSFVFIISVLSDLQAACIFSKPTEVKDLDIGNMLSWTTAEEFNNKFFLVQKSLDGNVYRTIGQVLGAGNSIQEQHYSFLDIALGEEQVFYRIRQIDTEGKSEDTPSILVNRRQKNNFVISGMSSTETDRFFTITMRSAIDCDVNYQLIDKSSRIIKNGTATVVKGANMIPMDLEGLRNDRYRLVIKNQKEVEQIYVNKVDASKVPKINYAVKE